MFWTYCGATFWRSFHFLSLHKKSNPSTDLFLWRVCPPTTAGCALDFALSFICLNHHVWEIWWLDLDYHVSLILVPELAFESHYNLSAYRITSSVDIYLRSIFTVGMRSLIYGWVLSIWITMFERFGDGLIHNIWEICWLGLDYHVSLILISELPFEYHYNLSASCITSSVDIYLRSIFTVGMRSLIYGWVLSIWFIMFERFVDDFIRLIYDVREICCWFDSSYLRDLLLGWIMMFERFLYLN